MKKVAFTIVSDNFYYPVGTHVFVNSFLKFHPDIPLVVFRQDMVDRVMKEKNIDFYSAKPAFANLLTGDYDLVANIDADTVITGRLTEVFDNTDYDIAGAWNFNDYENASFANITEEMYIQAGMVSSTNKRFWTHWEQENHNVRRYKRRENDILNLVVWNDLQDMTFKFYDKDKGYYGCKSLGREPEFTIENDQLMCRGEQVSAYHFARGGVFPKLNFNSMPLKDPVRDWLNALSYGQSYIINHAV